MYPNQEKIMSEHLKNYPNCKICKPRNYYGLTHLFVGLFIVVAAIIIGILSAF